MWKRYAGLLLATGAAIGAILWGNAKNREMEPEVTVYTLQPALLEETVACTGRIEAAESEDVYVTLPCVADKVLVKAGDAVNKGDVLFTVDVDSTREVIASAGGISSSLVDGAQIQKEIKASRSGTIRSLNVKGGETVGTDSPAAVISSGDTLQVAVAINENNIRDVRVGQKATVSGAAFSKDSYTGIITYIASSARLQYVGTASETVVDAIITLEEKDDSLRPGLSAKSRVLISSQPDGLIVPYEYVMQDGQEQEYVYIYEKGRAVRRPVETGRELSQGFEILSGLAPGDRVITESASIRRDGQRVRLEESE